MSFQVPMTPRAMMKRKETQFCRTLGRRKDDHKDWLASEMESQHI